MNVIDCMLTWSHLRNTDQNGACVLCGHKENYVIVNSDIDSKYSHDFSGTIVGVRDGGNTVLVKTLNDTICDVLRKAIEEGIPENLVEMDFQTT